MRPVLLKHIVRVLKFLDENGGRAKLEDIASVFGFSMRRVREILKTLKEFDLVDYSDDIVILLEGGRMLLKSYEGCDADAVLKLLLVHPAISQVYSNYVNGIKRPNELRNATGLNIVVIDTALRMLREIESLKQSCAKPSQQSLSTPKIPTSSEKDLPEKLSSFTQMLIEAYSSLTRTFRNRYVPIREVYRLVSQRMNLTVSEFSELLQVFAHLCHEYVTLTPAPLYILPVQTFEKGGKKYGYIMLSSEVEQCVKAKSLPKACNSC